MANRSKNSAPGAPVAAARSSAPRTRKLAADLAPEDTTLREFMADFHAAMSVMRLLRQEIAAVLSLSYAEYSVLLAVWHLERGGEMTVSTIAQHLHVAAAHVTAEVGNLVKRGLLTKRQDSHDRRAVGVGLTPASRELFRRLTPMLREINTRLFSDVYVRDFDVVRRFLAGIVEHGRDAIDTAQRFGEQPARRGRVAAASRR